MEALTENKPCITEIIDNIQCSMAKMPQVDCPLCHIFTPGMYIREIFMPAGTVVVSKIHKTEHPYIVSMGKVAVYNSEDDTVGVIEAPYTGITKPGTRRVLQIIESTIWTTFHKTDLVKGGENELSEEDKIKLAGEIEDVIIEKHEPQLTTRKEGILSVL